MPLTKIPKACLLRGVCLISFGRSLMDEVGFVQTPGWKSGGSAFGCPKKGPEAWIPYLRPGPAWS
jgi:hypothetical protein